MWPTGVVAGAFLGLGFWACWASVGWRKLLGRAGYAIGNPCVVFCLVSDFGWLISVEGVLCYQVHVLVRSYIGISVFVRLYAYSIIKKKVSGI